MEVSRMPHFFSRLVETLKKHRTCVVARIIRHSGSAPRETGTRCIILEDGTIQGTIGGGLLEFKVIEASQKVFAERSSRVLPFRLSGKELAGTEMLCGGEVDVYIEALHYDNPSALAVLEAAAAAVEHKQRGRLVTLISEGISSMAPSCRLFIAADGSWVGNLDSVCDSQRLPFEKLQRIRHSSLAEINGTDAFIFVEPVGLPDVVYLFGAGHISTCIVPLARAVGFHVVVIDDRKEFANREHFPDADEIRVVSFGEAFNDITITPSSYVVIVTRGHQHDGVVLKNALLKSDGYIGMIGSKRKRETIYKTLLAEGFEARRLERVHCPIGIGIGAETPEEIAVSIVGELISVRRQQHGGDV